MGPSMGKWGHPPVEFSVSACAVEVYIHLAVMLRKHSSRYCRRRRSVTPQATACVRSAAVPRAPSDIRLNRVLQWGTGGPWPSLCQVAGISQRPVRFLTPNLTDSSLRMRIKNISGTSSGGGAPLTNRLFSGTPDSGCVRHGFGSQFCKEFEGHAARGACPSAPLTMPRYEYSGAITWPALTRCGLPKRSVIVLSGSIPSALKMVAPRSAGYQPRVAG